MKLNFKLYAMGLMLAGALFATACQDSAEGEGSGEEARESVMNEDNNEQSASMKNDQSAQVNTNEVSAKQAAGEKSDTKKVDPNTPKTTMEFDDDVFDFGTVEKGEKVEHSYTFTNTGSEPLIISNAKASCGCTVPTWPKEPIAPGETGEIPVVFNARSAGNQTKTVTITANTNPPQTRLTVKGKVTEAEKSDS
jgi:hypothetical protein